MKSKGMYKIIIIACLFIMVSGFIKVNVQCNRTKDETIETMSANHKLYEDGSIKEEYLNLYNIVDNAPIKIFYNKNPLDIKILLPKFDIVINKEVFHYSMDKIKGNIKIKINSIRK
ncbi:hypothetical protein [Clostridium algidicarnis]|uniref:hypothetical protein n=1 Tax=Clostridium algidicarnis TaxID=37659 RepID=UPI0004950983|nr:hypothetical protein [Clostridium algidicarnis]